MPSGEMLAWHQFLVHSGIVTFIFLKNFWLKFVLCCLLQFDFPPALFADILFLLFEVISLCFCRPCWSGEHLQWCIFAAINTISVHTKHFMGPWFLCLIIPCLQFYCIFMKSVQYMVKFMYLLTNHFPENILKRFYCCTLLLILIWKVVQNPWN